MRSPSRCSVANLGVVPREVVFLLGVSGMESPAPTGQAEYGGNDEWGQDGVEHRSIDLERVPCVHRVILSSRI